MKTIIFEFVVMTTFWILFWVIVGASIFLAISMFV